MAGVEGEELLIPVEPGLADVKIEVGVVVYKQAHQPASCSVSSAR